MEPNAVPPAVEQLSELFGSYKAEWLRERIFEFFTEPAYFPELTTARPCVLIGGRGTGKTTVLRSLSYEGRFALSSKDPNKIPEWPYYGFYYRINTNRVTAFSGPELLDTQWPKVFGHYLNLLLCSSVLKFLQWYSANIPQAEMLSPVSCRRIGATLDIQAVSLADLLEGVGMLIIRFESFVNNMRPNQLPHLSMLGAPIDELFGQINLLPQFSGKPFFFLIDEYENLLDYQQTLFNTLIKHSGQNNYTFKIGVRELGWRMRTTSNPTEQLISPADYGRVSISEKLVGARFEEFARDVCNIRIARLQDDTKARPVSDIRVALPGLSEDDEAKLLGVLEASREVSEEIAAVLRSLDESPSLQLTALEAYFVKAWAESQGQSVDAVVREIVADRETWNERYGNYKHALLYTIRRGKRGIRKYYCGWDVFVQLASSNIRYLLELVDQSLLLHLRGGKNLSEAVSSSVQTDAAYAVGRKNLSELEGLSVHGAHLTKLLLGLGRVFGVMASEALGHAPEVNQFYLADEARPVIEGYQLLDAAVLHLALVRSTGSKLTSEADTRAYDYSIHPIYCPFFIFSYRKKRKMTLTSKQLIGLVRTPKDTIREVLRNNRRRGDEPLSDQLMLFEAYYGSNS